VFEAHSTAYMVMRFEQGQSFEAWLRGLGRPPTQEELDAVVDPLLGALETLHATNFLHRDIAPDNIIVRADGSPVLLDFGAARRAVAEMSRALTGIVKAGYSPHEQYSSNSRLQGPWSDLYALGGTLYRAVTGAPPVEATLRVDLDRLAPAAVAATGTYRPEFLAAIDTCLKVKHAERPRSVAQLRPMLRPDGSQPSRASVTSIKAPTTTPSRPPRSERTRRTNPPAIQSNPARRWAAAAAALLVVAGGAYGGYEFNRWQHAGGATVEAQGRAAQDVAGRQDAAQAEARRVAEQAAERKRADEARTAADADSRRKADEAVLQADEERRREEERVAAEQQRKAEEDRVAAEDARRKADAEAEERRREEERVRVASLTLNANDRAVFVRRVQQVLKQGGCYEGAINGRGPETQDELDRYIASAKRSGKADLPRIELAKASTADFENWLRDAEPIKGSLCATRPKPRDESAKVQRRREEAAEREERPRARAERREAEPRESSSPKMCWGPRNEYSAAACRN
jgi:hypothetical protein